MLQVDKLHQTTAVAISCAGFRFDRSHAPRGNAARDAPRPAANARLKPCAMVTQSVTGCIPTRSMGTIIGEN